MKKIFISVIIVIIVFVAGFLCLKYRYSHLISNSIQKMSDQNTKTNLNGWTKSPKFGLYYQSNLSVNEFYKGADGIPIEEMQKGAVPIFDVTFGENMNTIIIWGDNYHADRTCNEKTFGIFEYGVSRQACIKGYKTWIAHEDTQNVFTKDELKIFGDFVLKNQ